MNHLRIPQHWPKALQRWLLAEISRLSVGDQRRRLEALAIHPDMRAVATWLGAEEERAKAEGRDVSGALIRFIDRAYKAPETWTELKKSLERAGDLKTIANCSRDLIGAVKSQKQALLGLVWWFGSYPGSRLDPTLSDLMAQLSELADAIDRGFEPVEGFWAVPSIPARQDAKQVFCCLYLAKESFVDFAPLPEPPFKEVAITVSCLLDTEVTAQQVKRIWHRDQQVAEKSRTIDM